MMRMMRPTHVLWAVLVATVMALAGSPHAGAQFVGAPFGTTVQGQVVWPGVPPAGAILQVFLFDMTNPSYPEIIADQAINNPVGSPTPFRLTFDKRRVADRGTFGLQARIIYGNPPQVVYTSQQPVYVLGRAGETRATIRLVRVGADFGNGWPDRPGGRRFGRGVVRGTISLPIRRVPAGAILQVFLFDLTNRAAPQIVVDQAINNPGTNRIAYVLRFDPRFIDPTHTYGVQARVIYGSPPTVLFTSRPRTVYVLTQGNPTQADLTLRRARTL